MAQKCLFIAILYEEISCDMCLSVKTLTIKDCITVPKMKKKIPDRFPLRLSSFALLGQLEVLLGRVPSQPQGPSDHACRDQSEAGPTGNIKSL